MIEAINGKVYRYCSTIISHCLAPCNSIYEIMIPHVKLIPHTWADNFTCENTCETQISHIKMSKFYSEMLIFTCDMFWNIFTCCFSCSLKPCFNVVVIDGKLRKHAPATQYGNNNSKIEAIAIHFANLNLAIHFSSLNMQI